MMGQQKSNRADGTWGRSRGKNEKLCTDTARWRTYTVDSVRQRDIP